MSNQAGNQALRAAAVCPKRELTESGRARQEHARWEDTCVCWKERYILVNSAVWGPYRSFERFFERDSRTEPAPVERARVTALHTRRQAPLRERRTPERDAVNRSVEWSGGLVR